MALVTVVFQLFIILNGVPLIKNKLDSVCGHSTLICISDLILFKVKQQQSVSNKWCTVLSYIMLHIGSEQRK